MGADIEPGALVGQKLGKYELLALIAVGGTAEIYLARIGGEAGFEKYVVVKCLHDHLVHETEFVDMFLDEARLGAQLDHSNIVQTLELGEHKGRYYMAMEYLSGLSLAQMARAGYDRLPDGLLPTDLVLGLAAQACAGLHYAHERTSGGQPLNIVHRDISPQNLVVSFDGVLKLVDFGIAKAERRRTQTESGTIKGKFAYMSPEQCKAEKIDRRTDIFALGTIVHELITGRRLFKRDSTYETYQTIVKGRVPAPSSINRNLDKAIDQVVLKALAYQRNNRYPTAEAFGEALLGLVHKRGGSASASDVAAFFDAHFAIEIEEHAAQMRDVIAGNRKQAITGTWNIRDGGSDSSRRPSAQFVDELARDERPTTPGPRTGEPAERGKAPAAQAASLRELANQPSDDFEDNAETQIELDPMSQFEHLAGGAGKAPSPERAQRETGPTRQVMLPEASFGDDEATADPDSKRTMLQGTPANLPGTPGSASDLESRDTDEQPQTSSTLYRPGGAPPPTPPSAGARRNLGSSPARHASSSEGSARAPSLADAADTPLPTALPADAARPARALTAPTDQTSHGKPSATAVAFAFVVSAAIGFGATLLAGQLLG